MPETTCDNQDLHKRCMKRWRLMYLLYKDTVDSSIEQVSLVGLKTGCTLHQHSSLHHTCSILFHFKWRFFSPQEHIYCVFTAYAYLRACQQNSPQQLKICRTNLKLNTSVSINTEEPNTPCSWHSETYLEYLGGRTSRAADKRKLQFEPQIGAGRSMWVTAPAHRGIPAPPRHTRTQSYLKVNNLPIKYGFMARWGGPLRLTGVWVYFLGWGNCNILLLAPQNPLSQRAY